MSTSLIYRSARGYELLMRVLYGRHYEARMSVVAEQVPLGSSVLELCCGPGTLYTRHLRPRVSSYVGLDFNSGFVKKLRAEGIDARQVDLGRPGEPLPEADVVIMQASLYHFLPDARPIVEKMLAAARERMIVSEPIRNLASSSSPIVSRLGRRFTDPGVGGNARRFTEETLDRLMTAYGERVLDAFAIPGGREKVYVVAGEAVGARRVR
jgi:SAM-dependent methyltransferase